MSSFLINPYIYAVAAGCSGATIDLTSLMLYYKFNDNVNDSSGNGDNLTMSGSAAYAAGKFSNALDFDGTNFGYLSNSSYTISGATDISWGAWVKSDDVVSTRVVMTKYIATQGFGVGNETSHFYFFCAPGAYVEINTGVNSASAGTWTHLAATRKSSNGEFLVYKDGVYVTSGTTATGAFGNSTNNFMVSGQKISTTIQRKWDGLVDEAFVFHRVLSASEISTLYSSTCPLNS